MIRKEKLPRRNDKCPCGSGKKAKKCCLPSIKAFAALPQSVREQIVVARILQQHQPLLAAANAGSPSSPEVFTCCKRSSVARPARCARPRGSATFRKGVR